MIIALAQLNYHVGNFDQNKQKIIEAIKKAKASGAELIVFAELAITGYPPRDFLEFDDFLNRSQNSLIEIAQCCTDIAAIVGAPSINNGTNGKPLYNSAYFLSNAKIETIRHKTLLPTYDVFDEYRYFEPNTQFNIVTYKGKKIALTICEDLWIDNNAEHTDSRPLYTINPMEELAKYHPDFMVNIAASPFNYNQAERRQQVLSVKSKTYGIPLFYVNHVGAQTELLFDGGSLAFNKEGEIVGELAYFEEDFKLFDTEKVINQKPIERSISTKIERIHDALIMGIKNYFNKLGFKKAMLGLSGGIDSAVTFALAAKALGAENVWGILMPSHYSTDHSIIDAEALAKNLNAPYETISIEEIYYTFEQKLAPLFGDLPFNIAEENLQARSRAVLLMALSNKFGHILLNTSNKSEAAVGYGTLYGDMCGGLSVLGDVYKVEVFELARFINKEKEIIPLNTILKPPSAELRHGQKDSDSLPEYELLDAILYQYIEKRKGPSELVAMGFDKDTVNRILKMVNTNEHKRHQTPPILRVSEKAFGMGRRMPIVARYLL